MSEYYGTGEEERSSSCYWNSIYRASRSIKKRDNCLYNALRSIYDDSVFVTEISGLWPTLPLLANLRCGLWYSSLSRFDGGTCYFKSTDGHANNCSFSTSRLNLHVAQLAGQKGGCLIVDSTRKGKRFPDSMSKTIPIWTCVLNRAVKNFNSNRNDQWDCNLHLPVWVPKTEKAAIEDQLDRWTEHLEACGADIASLASLLTKPLRPLWISQSTLIWLNEIPDPHSWDFTPIILVSASATNETFCRLTTESRFSWRYIPGAGDDEETWARGLTPNLFWKHAFDLIDSGPGLCNQKVAEIIEKERVYRAQRGEFSPQVTVIPHKFKASNRDQLLENYRSIQSPIEDHSLSWIGATNIAVGATSGDVNAFDGVDCVLNCDSKSISFSPSPDAYLHLPIVSSKVDRFSLLNSLPLAVNFAKLHMSEQKKLLVFCHDGQDISICVCLAILTALFNERGSFDGGDSFLGTSITKWEMRKRLVFLCKFAINARPCRGNLKQGVFGFLCREKDSWPSVCLS